jgi:hypothetical protein
MAEPAVYKNFVAITKHDTDNIPTGLTKAIFVGGAGVVVAVHQDGSTVQFTAPAGATLPIQVKRVNSTDTTATLMVALY